MYPHKIIKQTSRIVRHQRTQAFPQTFKFSTHQQKSSLAFCSLSSKPLILECMTAHHFNSNFFMPHHPITFSISSFSSSSSSSSSNKFKATTSRDSTNENHYKRDPKRERFPTSCNQDEKPPKPFLHILRETVFGGVNAERRVPHAWYTHKFGPAPITAKPQNGLVIKKNGRDANRKMPTSHQPYWFFTAAVGFVIYLVVPYIVVKIAKLCGFV